MALDITPPEMLAELREAGVSVRSLWHDSETGGVVFVGVRTAHRALARGPERREVRGPTPPPNTNMTFT